MNDQEWFAAHAEYLQSLGWKLKREEVLKRDNYCCTARMSGCLGGALQVHHLSYRYWRDEPLFDLASVCTSCHDRITATDRTMRPKDVPGTLREQLSDGPFKICAHCRRAWPCPDYMTHGIKDTVLVR